MAALTSLSLFPPPSLRACTDVRPCRPGDTDQSVRKWHTYEPSTNFIGLNAEGNVDTVVFGLNLDYESIKQAGGGVWRGGGGGERGSEYLPGTSSRAHSKDQIPFVFDGLGTDRVPPSPRSGWIEIDFRSYPDMPLSCSRAACLFSHLVRKLSWRRLVCSVPHATSARGDCTRYAKLMSCLW